MCNQLTGCSDGGAISGGGDRDSVNGLIRQGNHAAAGAGGQGPPPRSTYTFMDKYTDQVNLVLTTTVTVVIICTSNVQCA